MAGFLDRFIKLWFIIRPFVIVKAPSEGIVLRLGRYHRSVKPGLHWLIPALDSLQSATTAMRYSCGCRQETICADGKTGSFFAMFRWRVTDPRLFLLHVHDGAGAVSEVVQAVSAESARANAEPDREAVLETAQGRLKGWGVALESVTYPSFVKCPVVRLIK